MATYAIGDLQGCYDELCHLLDYIGFNENRDSLWFVGDLINRGPASLKTLRFVKSLPHKQVVLGNHDLHLIALAWGYEYDPKHTLRPVIQAEDFLDIVHWLRQLPVAHYDEQLNHLMVHAGVLPQWSLQDILDINRRVQVIIQDDSQIERFIQYMYGSQRQQWTANLTPWQTLTVATNVLTRIRVCDADGTIDLKYKSPPGNEPEGFQPWFTWPRASASVPIVFGHWAALQGHADRQYNVHALDTGCVWGNQLTALRLEDHTAFCVNCS